MPRPAAGRSGRREPVLLEPVAEAQPSGDREGQDRRGQAGLKMPRPAFGHCGPPRLLGPRRLRGAGELGGAELLLHASQVGRHAPNHGRCVARAIFGLRRQAVHGQSDELDVGAAGGKPIHGVSRLASRGMAEDRHAIRSGEHRLAGQNLAEDRAQGEDVCPLVDRLDLAPGLLRRHVGRRAHHAAGSRRLRVRSRPAPWR